VQTVKSIPGCKMAVRYDPEVDPFFEVMVKDAIKDITKLAVGRDLLRQISACNPAHTGQAGVFPTGVNVLITPTDEKLSLHSPGSSKPTDTGVAGTDFVNASFNIDKDAYFEGSPDSPYYRTGAVVTHGSVDPTMGGNGRGSVSKVRFSNSRRQLTSGLVNPPFIALAHELVHALHSLRGEIKKNTTDEENRTVGLQTYAGEKLSENAFRAAARPPLPARTHY